MECLDISVGATVETKLSVINLNPPKNVFKKTNAVSKCRLVKFSKVSDSVWVCWKAVITKKTIKEK